MKFSKKKLAMLKKILGMLRTKIERKSAPMVTRVVTVVGVNVSVMSSYPATSIDECGFEVT